VMNITATNDPGTDGEGEEAPAEGAEAPKN
jgi:hypothetical protein